MPSKALLRGTEVLGEARAVAGAAAGGDRRAGRRGHARPPRRVHLALGRRRARSQWVDGAGIDLVRGTARLDRRADGRGDRRRRQRDPADRPARGRGVHRLRRRRCRRSTGCATSSRGRRGRRPAPRRSPAGCVVIGGGVVGCEMATAWRGLGVAGHPAGARRAAAAARWSRRPARPSPRRCATMGVDVRLGTEVQRRPPRRTARWCRLRPTARCAATRCWWPPAGAPGPPTSAWTRSGWSRASTSTSTTRCRSRGALALRRRRRQRPRAAHPHGQVPGPAGRRGDRRPRAAASRSSLADWSPFVATADHGATPSVVFTDPQVACGRADRRAGGGGRAAAPRGRVPARQRGRRGAVRRRVQRDGDRRRRSPSGRCCSGVTFVGPAVARAAAGGDDRRRRRGADRPAVARRPRLPDDQRGLAAPARDLPRLSVRTVPHRVWSCTRTGTARRRSAQVAAVDRAATACELVADRRRRRPGWGSPG